MKCFYHPNVDAVGTCAQCQKTACRECIEDVGGALLCVGCISLHQQHTHEEQKVAQIDRQLTAQRAKQRIFWSWIIGGVGLVFGVFPGIIQATEISNKNDLGAGVYVAIPALVVLFIVLTGYMFWSLYWSIPVVWGWTRKFVGMFGLPDVASLVGLVILLSCCISIPLATAVYYGMFGGAIYQFLKYRRIAASAI
jgi:hypothetical protein